MICFQIMARKFELFILKQKIIMGFLINKVTVELFFQNLVSMIFLFSTRVNWWGCIK